MNKKKLIYTIGMFYFLIDQIIKLIVSKTMHLNQQIYIIKNFFSIYYVKNEGAAFSILENKTYLLIIISVGCLIFLKKYIKDMKTPSNLSIISLGILIGGILGNMFDRIFYRSVTDYLSFQIANRYFPVFNLADIGITIGILLYCIIILLEDKKVGAKDE